ncbi:SAP domain-containing protein [Caenorhabditis elegans]|uniref:SAP domain-containing protein n=1 Tax=Caenorhabditis elegans TaxID=6239 RepID=Q22145_CAEEL|nr:SAP domain-containing protein [Caenorhabditis elegans]CAA84736.3 SAP domain-containing protein [Caenorhabditis elegans]|eukprot:NP_497968.3 High Incidence of Males (increased X chromosome loss) [Caenorhabditis elegans]
MNDSSLKKALSQNSISSAPRRPQKLGSVQSIVRNESDKNVPSPFEEITLSDDDEEAPAKKPVKCATCARDMTLWMNSRRDIHVKVCKAKQSEKEKETTRKSKTLTETIEKDDQVYEKPSSKTHLFEKPFEKPQELPKSWELSKNNVKFARIAEDDEENRKRKRPRSFAVVELAPKKCQCEVLTTLHSRFIDEFHSKSIKNQKKREEGVTEHAFQMKKMIEKISRYEQLSSDMQKVLDDNSEQLPTHIFITCSDGHRVKCQTMILKHRTSLIRLNPKSENIQVEHTKEVVKAWISFVFTANIEWNDDDKDGVRDLASKYGPVGLDLIVKNDKEEDLEKVDDVEDVVEPEAKIDSVVADPVEIEPTASHSDPIELDKSVNYFTSDDPFFGFGKAVENVEDDAEQIMEDKPHESVHSTPQKPTTNVTMDSFDEWSNQPSTNLPTTSNVITPIRNITSKAVFGSHVKILKTNDITPMPAFDSMEEAELKERMKEIGMRPKGKKAMIQILKKAYITLHPEICSGTPTIRPLVRSASLEKVSEQGGKGGRKTIKTKTLSERMIASPKKVSPKKQGVKNAISDETSKNVSNVSDDLDEDNDGDKTLNISNDEREVGKICGDDVGDDEEDDDDMSASSTSGKHDLSALKLAFLTWLRSDQNTVLHEHILSLQPVSLEEMLIRLEKADGPLGRIGKGKLVKLLEMLKITYQLPQKTGRARGGYKRRL